MPFKNIVKALLEVKHTVIDKFSIENNSLVIDVHPTKSFRHRCGLCGHRGTFYDYGNGKGPRLWRCTDFEGHKVFLRYSTYRVYCPHCKTVHTCKVPWVAHGSRFTRYMRIAWRSVDEIASRVKDDKGLHREILHEREALRGPVPCRRMDHGSPGPGTRRVLAQGQD